MTISITSSNRLLFIGDSITDCGRAADPDHLGTGYVRLIRDYLAAKDPARVPLIMNRGSSGHKVTDLRDRWQRDVIDEKPDLLSILIGINDVWHGLMSGLTGVPAAQYVQVYRELLRQVRSRLPRCAMVLCEPTVIWPPQPADGKERLKPYVQAVGELSREFSAEYLVPLHETFESARRENPNLPWAPDGVHPSSAGHMLIARTWLATTGVL